MNTGGNDNDNGCDNESDPLWRLLGRAEAPAVSPFFSRNVLREIRALEQEKPGLLGWIRGNGRLAWASVTAATAAAVVLAFVGIRGTGDRRALAAKAEPKQEVLVAQLAKNPDSEVIKNLDELLASEDNSVWLDNSAN